MVLQCSPRNKIDGVLHGYSFSALLCDTETTYFNESIFCRLDCIIHCQEYFGFDLPSVLWAKHMKFEVTFGLYLFSE